MAYSLLATIVPWGSAPRQVSWPVPDKNGLINVDWAAMQVMTSQDYGHGSWFWTVFSGSLNYQVVHHLFPGVNQYYYPMIAPIVMKTCAEFGIKYHVKVRCGGYVLRSPYGR